MTITSETIISKLHELEKDQNVKILLAVESGSRARGFESIDSDYDVRFIYTHDVNWYLSLEPGRDVIEYMEGLLDLSGRDLRKTLVLLKKSNPPLLEWIKSPITYLKDEKFHNDLIGLEKDFFSPKSCLYHYLQMAKGNYREYLKRDLVRVKKYFYVLRPIFACIRIEKYNSPPPMEFSYLLDDALKNDPELKDEVEKLLARKMSGEELATEPAIIILNDYLEKQIKRLEEVAIKLETSRGDSDLLDLIFRKYIPSSL